MSEQMAIVSIQPFRPNRRDLIYAPTRLEKGNLYGFAYYIALCGTWATWDARKWPNAAPYARPIALTLTRN